MKNLNYSEISIDEKKKYIADYLQIIPENKIQLIYDILRFHDGTSNFQDAILNFLKIEKKDRRKIDSAVPVNCSNAVNELFGEGSKRQLLVFDYRRQNFGELISLSHLVGMRLLNNIHY